MLEARGSFAFQKVFILLICSPLLNCVVRGRSLRPQTRLFSRDEFAAAYHRMAVVRQTDFLVQSSNIRERHENKLLHLNLCFVAIYGYLPAINKY
jgi:hypothetical protein